MSTITKRLYGDMTTYETRAESHESINKQERYRQILEILGDNEMTAKEIAVEMHRRGYTPTSERNFSAPRLTELLKQGKVDVIGKKSCRYTNKTVSVFARRG